MQELTITTKQSKIGTAIAEDKKEIFLFGSIGTSKTFGACIAAVSLCMKFAGARFVVGRRHYTELKKGTLYSFIEAIDKMGIKQYQLNYQDMVLTLPNGSQILFIELDHTKDRQFYRVKSINCLAAMIDEVDGVTQDAYIALFSRTGRQKISGAPNFILSTMNPSGGWVKDYMYKPYKAGIMNRNMAVIEFTPQDSFLGKEYYEKFDGMPLPWRKRYLLNDFDYEDDQNSLFKYRHFDAGRTSELDRSVARFIGYDVARSGSDRSVCALWYGKTLVDIQIVKDKDEEMMTDDQGLWLIRFLSENAVLPNNIAVDGVGLGVGVIDFMKSRGMMPNAFISGGKPTEETYDNLRSEVIYHFSRGLETGEIKIYEGCPYRNELISEAMAHNHDTTDKKLAVESKDKVKERTGSLSPDIFDSVVMGLAPQLKAAEGYGIIW